MLKTFIALLFFVYFARGSSGPASAASVYCNNKYNSIYYSKEFSACFDFKMANPNAEFVLNKPNSPPPKKVVPESAYTHLGPVEYCKNIKKLSKCTCQYADCLEFRIASPTKVFTVNTLAYEPEDEEEENNLAFEDQSSCSFDCSEYINHETGSPICQCSSPAIFEHNFKVGSHCATVRDVVKMPSQVQQELKGAIAGKCGRRGCSCHVPSFKKLSL